MLQEVYFLNVIDYSAILFDEAFKLTGNGVSPIYLFVYVATTAQIQESIYNILAETSKCLEEMSKTMSLFLF